MDHATKTIDRAIEKTALKIEERILNDVEKRLGVQETAMKITSTACIAVGGGGLLIIYAPAAGPSVAGSLGLSGTTGTMLSGDVTYGMTQLGYSAIETLKL